VPFTLFGLDERLLAWLIRFSAAFRSKLDFLTSQTRDLSTLSSTPTTSLPQYQQLQSFNVEQQTTSQITALYHVHRPYCTSTVTSPAMDSAALIVVDLQEDFCPPVYFIAYKSGPSANQEQNGALAVQNGRDIVPVINTFLELKFKIKIATQDYHPHNHCSFASQHKGAKPFTSTHTVTNPEATDPTAAESQQITLWPDHCVQDTPGCEFVPELDLSEIHRIVRKGEDPRVEAYSGFGPDFRKPAVAMTCMAELLREHGIKHVIVCGLALDYCVRYTAIDAAKEGFRVTVVEDATKAVNQDAETLRDVRDDLEAHGVQLLKATSTKFII
jgi:nicotinamidase-related amidase